MTTVEDNTSRLTALMRASSKKIDQATRRGVKKALALVKKEAVANLRARVPGAGRRSKKSKYNDTLIKGVYASKVWTNQRTSGVAGKVSAMGNRKPGSGTFRTRFFELGTVQRKVKSYRKIPRTPGLNRGSIHAGGRVKALHFMTDITHNTVRIKGIVEAEVAKAVHAIK